ncbi:hypothetical protein ACO2Q3_10145 [Caulobacter sp. KR2-114]|uniref:hypothetical protein n=1 Tax=Caulobacter sp. KR2-114 TaxID=3400912 RepID=UPI003C10096C
MSAPLFLSIVGLGFFVAFMHAAIPTHWLPFALTSRAQGWSAPKTLAITAAAGVGHGLFTTAIGVVIVALGMQLSERAGAIFHLVAGGALFCFGLYYLVRQWRGDGHAHLIGGAAHNHGHGHGHGHADHDHPRQAHVGFAPGHDPICEDETLGEAMVDAPPPRRSDRAAIASLFALLTFSPCESFLPVFLSGARYGWTAFILLSLILALATLAGMLVFTSLSLAGLSRLRLGALERYEGLILGLLLCALGLAVVFLET